MDDKQGRLSPMLEVIEELKESGYTMEFFVNDGKIHDRDRSQYFEPENMKIDNIYRFEGQSDPEYMGILYAISDNKGTKGYISNAYGPQANAETDEMIDKMEDASKDDKTRSDRTF